jgi:hypothetical protein
MERLTSDKKTTANGWNGGKSLNRHLRKGTGELASQVPAMLDRTKSRAFAHARSFIACRWNPGLTSAFGAA